VIYLLLEAKLSVVLRIPSLHLGVSAASNAEMSSGSDLSHEAAGSHFLTFNRCKFAGRCGSVTIRTYLHMRHLRLAFHFCLDSRSRAYHGLLAMSGAAA
jgi:hypothetical protein